MKKVTVASGMRLDFRECQTRLAKKRPRKKGREKMGFKKMKSHSMPKDARGKRYGMTLSLIPFKLKVKGSKSRGNMTWEFCIKTTTNMKDGSRPRQNRNA